MKAFSPSPIPCERLSGALWTALLLLLLAASERALADARIDLRASMTPPKHQQGRNTCSVFAATALMEYLLKAETGREVDLSEQYSYWLAKERTLTDGFLRNAYAHMDGLAGFLAVEAYRFGSMLESEWPYESQSWQQSGDSRCKTVNGKPVTACFTGTPPSGARGLRYGMTPVRIHRRKIGSFMLREKKPVVMNILLPSGVVDNRTGRIRMPTPQEAREARQQGRGHVITLVGYSQQHRQFLFKNSYGPGWGTDGYGTIPEDYIVEHCEVCPALRNLTGLSARRRDFIISASMGVSGTLKRLPRGDELPSVLGNTVVYLSDPELVYVPRSRKLTIIAEGAVLDSGRSWSFERVSSGLYLLRDEGWKGFAWKIDVTKGRLYLSGQGTTDKAIGEVTDFTGTEGKPTRIGVRLHEVHIVFGADDGLFQLVAGGTVLSQGSNWRVKRLTADRFHIARKGWRDFFWLADTTKGRLYRIVGGDFGRSDGHRELLQARMKTGR